MNTIFIGYDSKEPVAFHVLSHSILRNSSKPISIIPLNLKNLSNLYERNFDHRQSNEFSFTRFLVPYLTNFSGRAIFMDCDMLVTCDISELFDRLETSKKAVHLVKHDYKSKVDTKYLGNKQYNYPRKNWSSFVYWNCEHEKNLKLDLNVVNNEPPEYLHRFKWLNDDEIGDLGKSWNFLVGEYDKPKITPNVIHWTLGGPYFNDFKETDYASLWNAEKNLAFHCDQWK